MLLIIVFFSIGGFIFSGVRILGAPVYYFVLLLLAQSSLEVISKNHKNSLYNMIGFY